MLTGTIAVPQFPALNCQGKTGRAEGRGMPYKNYNGEQRRAKVEVINTHGMPTTFQVLLKNRL